MTHKVDDGRCLQVWLELGFCWKLFIIEADACLSLGSQGLIADLSINIDAASRLICGKSWCRRLRLVNSVMSSL